MAGRDPGHFHFLLHPALSACGGGGTQASQMAAAWR
jgi:hypothetical protein